MAWIRTVKPEVALHEGLFDLEKETGLAIRFFWVALILQADREGRFEWRPRPLKALCAPYDDIDFADVLNAFARAGFIVRYEADGKEYGWIPTFHRHQSINSKERQSKIPPPPESYTASRCGSSDEFLGTPRNSEEERNGTEQERNGTGTDLGAGEPRNQDPLPEEHPPSPEPGPEPEPPKQRERAEDVPVPRELDTPEFRETWAKWIANRRSHRWPMGADFARTKLEAFTRYGPKASASAMRESIEQGYQGCFPENFDLMTGAKNRGNGKRNEPVRVGAGQRFQGTGDDRSGEAAGGGYVAEAGVGLGAQGRVANGRWHGS